MEGLADEQKMAAANATLTQMKQAMFNLITPRVENAPEQFTNRNSLAAFSGTGWPSGMLIRR
jgi:16S rRNA G966 N2-methylase RsmD